MLVGSFPNVINIGLRSYTTCLAYDARASYSAFRVSCASTIIMHPLVGGKFQIQSTKQKKNKTLAANVRRADSVVDGKIGERRRRSFVVCDGLKNQKTNK